MATVESDAEPLVTIAVCERSRESARPWAMLREAFGGSAGDPPPPPWCAVKIHPALAADFVATAWLGDYERCLAWGWIETRVVR